MKKKDMPIGSRWRIDSWRDEEYVEVKYHGKVKFFSIDDAKEESAYFYSHEWIPFKKPKKKST